MDKQLFTVMITLFSGMATVIGFFCSYMLYSILNKQTSLEEKFIVVLTKLEAFQEQQKNQDNLIDMVIEQIKLKCDRDSCYFLNRREHIPSRDIDRGGNTY